MEKLPPLEKKVIIFENRFRDRLGGILELFSSNIAWP